MIERLDKYVASQTTLSRREAVKAIRGGRVTLNGAVCRIPDTKADTDADGISLDGRTLHYRGAVYYMMHKPAGVVSATEDAVEKTVLDLLPQEMRRPGLFPAGRLDKDTTGLLIITDDGDYAHRMLSPKKHVTKEYIATLDKEPGEEIAPAFEKGTILSDGTVCQSAVAEKLDERRVRVEMHEGKYHQVKRMFAALGYHVAALERVRIGALELDQSLSPGEVRELTEQEAQAVFKLKKFG